MKLSKKISILISLASITALASCGGSSNNDQGTSFTAFGFFKDSTGDAGDAGNILPLFTDVSPTQTDGLYATTFIGVQNNLSSQFIRVDRIDCRYEVEGSFIEVPNDSFPSNIVLGALPSTDQTTTPTTGTNTISNQGYSEFIVVSPDIYSFLNNNKSYLPELPFRMTATCDATGVTQAGDVLTSNPLNYFVQFVDQSECCTGTGATPGFQTGPGAGGDLITAEGDATTTTSALDTIALTSNGSSSDSTSSSSTVAP